MGREDVVAVNGFLLLAFPFFGLRDTAGMKNKKIPIEFWISFSFLVFQIPLEATDYLSYRVDQQSTGQNLSETVLTPTSIVSGSFKKMWTTPVDGNIYAQPLYQANVSITSAGHQGVNAVVFAASEHDTVYAFEAKTGTILWQRSLLDPKYALPGVATITTVPFKDVAGPPDITPEIGITGTPVIDGLHGYLYVVGKSKQIVSADIAHPLYAYTLFKIAISDGSVNGFRIIAATYQVGPNFGDYVYRTADDPAADQDPFVMGSGDGAITINGESRVYFNAMRQMNRPGALLFAGDIYLAFASHTDRDPYHGWLLSFDANTLKLNGAFNTTPNGGRGGIWQSGGIPTVDADGNFYFTTGNGTFDGTSDPAATGLDANGFPLKGNYGDCFVKLGRDGKTTAATQGLNGWGFKVLDYFSPMENQVLDQNDLDFGSGGAILLPDSAGSSSHRHLAAVVAKTGKLYLLDRDNMGKFSPTNDNIVAGLANAVHGQAPIGDGLGQGSYGTPAWFNGSLYLSSCDDVVKSFTVTNATISSAPLSSSTDSDGRRQGSPMVSASGTANGLVWVASFGNDVLRAYDAQDLSKEYWTSPKGPAPDAVGTVVKFSTPTVADGMVFVGTMNTVCGYGLGATATPTP